MLLSNSSSEEITNVLLLSCDSTRGDERSTVSPDEGKSIGEDVGEVLFSDEYSTFRILLFFGLDPYVPTFSSDDVDETPPLANSCLFTASGLYVVSSSFFVGEVGPK